MSSQLFKIIIPIQILYELLDCVCVKTPTYYILNNDAFKKGMYTQNIQQFVEICIPYYHVSKRKYLEKKMTFNSFVTIIRQICNTHNITYTSYIKYDKSKYNIVYHIHYS